MGGDIWTLLRGQVSSMGNLLKHPVVDVFHGTEFFFFRLLLVVSTGRSTLLYCFAGAWSQGFHAFWCAFFC